MRKLTRSQLYWLGCYIRPWAMYPELFRYNPSIRRLLARGLIKQLPHRKTYYQITDAGLRALAKFDPAHN